MTGTAWPSIDLVDDPVVADEEAAFGDVALRRRRREGAGVALPGNGGGGEGGDGLGQAADRGGELLGQVAGRFDAVAGGVEPVLAAPACPAPSRDGSGNSD